MNHSPLLFPYPLTNNTYKVLRSLICYLKCNHS
nr:MAG TPA: hypothetical protein [Caudoviricetes sp.]